MDTKGKAMSIFRKVGKTFRSFGRRSTGSSSNSGEFPYQLLVDPDIEPSSDSFGEAKVEDRVESKVSKRLSQSTIGILSSSNSDEFAYQIVGDPDIESSLDLSGEPKVKAKVIKRPNQGKGHRGVPKGHLPVYVGQEKKQFVIKIEYLNHDLFRTLLTLSGGSQRNGGLTKVDSDSSSGIQRNEGFSVHCEPSFFENMLEVVENDLHIPKSERHGVLKGQLSAFVETERREATRDLNRVTKS